MATKAEMVRARRNAYNMGWRNQTVEGLAVVITNPYRKGTKSNTHDAFFIGAYDARKGNKQDSSKMEAT